jgi:hypothetical protein
MNKNRYVLSKKDLFDLTPEWLNLSQMILFLFQFTCVHQNFIQLNFLFLVRLDA